MQSDKNLEWDTKLNPSLMKEWTNICKLANASKPIEMDRFVGNQDSSYSLVAFTDSSHNIYGTVIYIIDNETGKVSYLLAKNRLLGSSMKNKTIPSLKLQAICFGAEVLIDIFNELSGKKAVLPIKITKLSLYTDSMVSLNRIESYVYKFDKMQKQSVFVLNRLRRLNELCEIHPIHFILLGGKVIQATT